MWKFGILALGWQSSQFIIDGYNNVVISVHPHAVFLCLIVQLCTLDGLNRLGIEHKTSFEEFDICWAHTSAIVETTIFGWWHSTLQQTDIVLA